MSAGRAAAAPQDRTHEFHGAFMLLYSDMEDFVRLGTLNAEPSAKHLAEHRLVQFQTLMNFAMQRAGASPGASPEKDKV